MQISKQSKLPLVASFVVTFLYMLGSYLILIDQPQYLTQVIVKAIGTIIVLGVIALNVKDLKGWKILPVIIIFCLIGDILLASLKLVSQPDLVFQLGVGSFFIGYLMLGILLLNKSQGVSMPIKLTALILVSMIGVVQYFTLTITGSMAIVVMAYIGMTTILLTGATSYLLTDIKRNGYFFGAGLMFYISDSIIAQNAFGSRDVYGAEILIMATYALGHSCLILGSSKLSNDASI